MAVLRWTNGEAKGLKMLAPADIEVVSLQVRLKGAQHRVCEHNARRLSGARPAGALAGCAGTRERWMAATACPPCFCTTAGAAGQAARTWRPQARALWQLPAHVPAMALAGRAPLRLGASSPSGAACSLSPRQHLGSGISTTPRCPAACTPCLQRGGRGGDAGGHPGSAAAGRPLARQPRAALLERQPVGEWLRLFAFNCNCESPPCF